MGKSVESVPWTESDDGNGGGKQVGQETMDIQDITEGVQNMEQ